MKLFIAGDFCESDRIKGLLSSESVTYLIGDMENAIKAADYSIVNFEFPIVSGTGHTAIKKDGPNLKGTEKAVGFLKSAGFKACTLANNHILDWGAPAALYTKEYLEKNGLATVGFGSNVTEAGSILYYTKGNETLAIINCCEHEFSVTEKNKPGANALDPIAQYYSIKEAKKKANYVVVIVHGGIEMLQLPTVEMMKNYRFFVDSGADIVVNHHQHCYSGFENYKGKFIFYGLGNFLFDWEGKRNSSWNEGMAVSFDLSSDTIVYNLHSYTQCNEEPNIKTKGIDDFMFSKYSLTQLQEIIVNEKELDKLLADYYTENCESELNKLEPYKGFISSRLFAHGLLPSTLSMPKAIGLLNRISCESHRERIVFALKQWIINH